MPRKKKENTSNAVTVKPKAKISYINNDQKRGLKYDAKLIRKTFAALGCPPEYFDPTRRPFERMKYLVEFSRRGTGKTTGVLLLGLVFNWLYGTQTIYIRQTEDMIAPKMTKDLFGTIVSLGYIEKLTGGIYNSVTYKSRRWYLCHVTPEGDVDLVANDYFCFMCDIQHANNLKSGFASPLGDFIVYDEFVNPFYYPDEFVCFCDLLSTIIRQRFSPIVWMLSNNTDKESPYFYEFEIYDEVQALSKGSSGERITEKGTGVFFEWYAPETEVKKSSTILDAMNQLFFGFKNRKLGSITGEDWAIKPVQRIPKVEDDIEETVMIRNLYVYNNKRYLRLQVVNRSDLGLCCYVHWATRVYDDSVILTTEDRLDNRYQYGYGSGRLQRLLAKLISENRLYYASNDVAAFLRAYIKNLPPTL